jgi:hypothetical protein
MCKASSDGKCLSETDGGKDYLIPGSCRTSTSTSEIKDYCDSSGNLREAWCNNGKCEVETKNCLAYGTNYKCIYDQTRWEAYCGKDSAPTPSGCTDSDGGLVYQIAGTCTDGSSTKRDYCDPSTGWLQEASCSGGKCAFTVKNCVVYGNGWKCVLGGNGAACVNP